MKCINCESTMSLLGCRFTEHPAYWCPNCGTLKPCDFNFVTPATVKERNVKNQDKDLASGDGGEIPNDGATV